MGSIVISILTPEYFFRKVSVGQELDIPVYLHLQMEGICIVPLLVGFPGIRDREFFEKFISISGIGVRAAVKALERPPHRIASAIASGDHNYLSTLRGIGQKRAKQIVVGLQEQMIKMYGAVSAADIDSEAGIEAYAVLRQLGVPAAEVDRLIGKAIELLGDDAGTSDIVKHAMRIRSKK